MIIKKVQIKNFRCLKDVTLECEPLTILIGRNGSGKSSFLKGLELFYEPNAKYSEKDYFNNDTSQPIEIYVTFEDLSDKEKNFFSRHLDGDILTVCKKLFLENNKGIQKYYGNAKHNPDFQEVRLAERVAEKRQTYRDLLNKYTDLTDLPGNVSEINIENALNKWENDHPDSLQLIKDEGQFFGFKEVGQAKLEKFTQFIFIPAVRDASEEAAEGKNSAITQLIDMLVRKTLFEREEIKNFRDEYNQKYKNIIDPQKMPELQELGEKLTELIQRFAAETKISITWESQDIEPPLPKADVKIIEDDFETTIERVGHGTQRAFIFASLNQLAITQAIQTSEENETSAVHSDIVLGVEEPEIYQHPSRIRNLLKTFQELASKSIPGVGKIQVFYSTHSPLLVDLRCFEKTRLFRKVISNNEMPKVTQVYSADMNCVTTLIESAEDGTQGTFIPKHTMAGLQTLMTPWINEGFFADLVVLIEGEEDRALILAQASVKGFDFDNEGISTIPCNGKTNLLKAAAVFKAFNIPIYLIWDCDKGSYDPHVEYNLSLQRFFGTSEPKEYLETVESNFSCFEKDITTTVENDFGKDYWQKQLEICRSKYSYDSVDHIKKNPLILHEVIEELNKNFNRTSKTLEKIVENIYNRREGD